MGKKKKDWKKKYYKEKYKNKNRKGGHHQKKKKMGLGTKVLIGAGIAAVAVGGLYLGKYCYDKHKANQKKKLMGPGSSVSGGGNYSSFQKREVVDDGPPPPALAKYMGKTDPNVYLNSMETISVPDALAVGLGWDHDQGTDYDLLAAAYSATGENLGFIQGTADRTSLFGKAITHTGDNDGTGVDTVLGDSENIIFDLRAVPKQCTQILFGCILVTLPHDLHSSRPYLHMLPMMREETIKSQIASGGTRTIQYDDSDDEDDFEESSSSPYHTGPQHGPYHTGPQHGTRGINDNDDDDDGDDGRHKFVKLFHAELGQYQNMLQEKGFVAGKFFRTGSDWHFTPYRMVVASDPQYGLWPALDYYATLSDQQQQQQQPCYQQQQQNSLDYSQQYPQSNFSYPPQSYVDPYSSYQQQQQQPQLGYNSQPDYNSQSAYSQPDYNSQSAYLSQPGYNSQPCYDSQSGYGSQYGSQQPQQPGYYYPQ